MAQMKDKLKTALAGKELPKRPPGAIKDLKDLKAGWMILIAYAATPARVAGTYGAEVVTVSKDQKFASIKLLTPNRGARSAGLKQTPGQIVDSNDCAVEVSYPSPEEDRRLRMMKSAFDRTSIDISPPKQGELLAFVYPESADWSGVYIGSLAYVSPPEDGAVKYRVVFYNVSYLKTYPDDAIEEIPFRAESGVWTDQKYNVQMLSVRRVTPGEAQRYEDARNAVAAERAIPNARPPKKKK
jgi:hypothetical protein